jgi:hypothetical protein
MTKRLSLWPISLRFSFRHWVGSCCLGPLNQPEMGLQHARRAPITPTSAAESSAPPPSSSLGRFLDLTGAATDGALSP